MSIKLEYGKKYVCRNGAVVGPMGENPVATSMYPFWCGVDPKVFSGQSAVTWTENGDFRIEYKNDDYDIVAEYHEYVWKWMVPDKPGVWALGGLLNRPSDTPNEVAAFPTKPKVHCEGWCCFLMDLPQIQMPPKQRVTKRLWLRKTEGCIITLKTEEQKAADPFYSFAYQERWETNDIVPEGWISTNVTKEFEE